MKKILNFCLTFLLLAVCLNTAAQDIKLPAKPFFTHVADIGNYFGSGEKELTELNLEGSTYFPHSPLYILTVPDDYTPFLEAYGRFVADNWQICGDKDSAVLLLLTAEQKPKAFILAGKLNRLMSDTMCAFYANNIIPRDIDMEYIYDVAKDFQRELDMDPDFIRSLHGNIYEDFKKTFNPKMTVAKRAEAEAASNATIGNVLMWFVVLILNSILLYYIYRFIKKTLYPPAKPMYHRPTPQPPAVKRTQHKH